MCLRVYVTDDLSHPAPIATRIRDANIANQKLMKDTLVLQLADLVPGAGLSYLNEGDPWEPKWQYVFYGPGYQRLLAIKSSYDHESLLYARTAVGSEYCVENEDGRLCRANAATTR